MGRKGKVAGRISSVWTALDAEGHKASKQAKKAADTCIYRTTRKRN